MANTFGSGDLSGGNNKGVRVPVSTVSACRVVVYSYRNRVVTGSVAETTSNRIEIQKEMLSYEYTKNIGSPSGSFTFQVTANKNWKAVISPGDWVVVYLSNEGKEHKRLLGNVDRVSQFTTRNDKGLLETSYVISGRDFGKVFETTNIWFHPLNTTKLILPVILLKGSPDTLINKLLGLFLGKDIPIKALLKQIQLFQYQVLPIGLALELGATGISFYDILQKNTQKLQGKKVIDNLSTIQGDIWSILKSNSNDVVNELYTELIDGKPTITLRTKPFAKKSITNGPTSDINYFLDLDQVIVKGADIIGSDLGTSDEDRFNLFLMTANADFLGVSQLASQLRPNWPNIQQASIQRYGLRIMYVDTDFALVSGDGKNEKIKPELLREWNELLYHFYNNAIFLEAGTIELEKANPNIKVGKTLIIQQSQINQNKIFYIEGYSDNWSYPGNWKQSLQLTRGQYLVKGSEKFTYTIDSKDKVYTGQTVYSKVVR